MNRPATICILILVFASQLVARESYWIDDCDDGDHQTAAGGWWYTYDDAPTGGNSKVQPPHGRFFMGKPGCGEKGYAARMKGTTGNRLGWDYIGMGITLGPSSNCPRSLPVDLTGYSYLRFRMRGTVSGGRLTVVLPHTENRCVAGAEGQETLTEWADYEAPVTGKIRTDWVTVSLNFRKEFHQPRWARQHAIVPIDTVLRNLKNVNFHFSSPDGDSIDLWIDDMEIVK